MTCEETRRLATEKEPSECTRAERTAVWNHARNCSKCRQFVCNLLIPMRVNKSLAERVLEAIEDLADPEARA